jgi:hypothetical protein
MPSVFFGARHAVISGAVEATEDSTAADNLDCATLEGRIPGGHKMKRESVIEPSVMGVALVTKVRSNQAHVDRALAFQQGE